MYGISVGGSKVIWEWVDELVIMLLKALYQFGIDFIEMLMIKDSSPYQIANAELFLCALSLRELSSSNRR